jgi:peroxiredoxin
LADYRKDYEAIRAAGADVVAVSVDPPQRAELMRRELQLPLVVLCDTERHVVREWGIYNERERGGIAKPCVFIIERDRTVRYFSLDDVAKRVPATEILRLFKSTGNMGDARRKVYIPSPTDMFRAIRNNLRGKPRGSASRNL